MLYRQNEKYDFRYDYTKCMMMKLGMAYPEPKNTEKSHVLMTFEQALECIKRVDAMTPGIKKLYYLVGWQYNGHDDKYPDFFEVNKALKRNEDASARDSLIWLYNEAKRYNSVVSLHINFNDAYADAPSFEDFKEKCALIRGKNGLPKAIEKYNGKKCYKTCFKSYWESGLFKRQVDRLLTLLPFLTEAGTVHVDNFQCYTNRSPHISVTEMQEYRRKMIDYLHRKGIDITSEFTYKEDDRLPNRKLFGLPREHHRKTPMDTVGLIPASWWCTRMTRAELTEVPPQLYGGGLYKDRNYGKYLYGNMHGEDSISANTPNWEEKFLDEFATVQAPYHFLCTHKRLKISGFLLSERCEFSDNIVSYLKNQKITQNGNIIKEGNTLCLPYIHKDNCFFAYSRDGDEREWKLHFQGEKAEIYKITPTGLCLKEISEIKNDRLKLKIEPREALLLSIK